MHFFDVRHLSIWFPRNEIEEVIKFQYIENIHIYSLYHIHWLFLNLCLQ